MAAYIDRIGHRKVRLRTDNEPSIMEIAKLVSKKREQETVVETTPRYSSASNGRAERTIQTIRKQMVTLKLAAESRYGFKLTAGHAAWGWLARHAAWLIARYHVKLNRRTAYSEVFEEEYRGSLVEWGETVLFRRPRPEHRKVGEETLRKGESGWERGIWLGKAEESDEHLVGARA